jgi:hypothetical protein
METRIGETETVVVVAVVGVVVVAIGNPTVGRVVVPAAPAQHPVGAFRSSLPITSCVVLISGC